MAHTSELELHFTLKAEDIVAFRHCLAAHSPEFRRARKKAATWFALSGLSAYGLLALAGWKVTSSVIALPFLLALGVASFWVMEIVSVRLMRYQLAHNRPKHLCQHQMLLTAEGVRLIHPEGDTLIKFKSLHNVQETSTHGFIFHSWNFAWIIPKEGIIEGNFDTFMGTLEQRFKAAQST